MGILQKTVSVLAVLALMTGCSTLADTRNAEGTGKTITYSKNIDEVWPIALLALQDLGLDVIEVNRAQGYILAKRNISALSYGENVAIFVRPASAGKTNVEVLSKKVLATTVFAPDWTEDIFRRINIRLNK